jgi:hypothetical protein
MFCLFAPLFSKQSFNDNKLNVSWRQMMIILKQEIGLYGGTYLFVNRGDARIRLEKQKCIPPVGLATEI